MNYNDFLQEKHTKVLPSGIPDGISIELNSKLFQFQRDIVTWALRLGKAAIFEDCGLGKTFQQLEFARVASEFTSLPSLVLAPLAVSNQTIAEGTKFGIPVEKYANQRQSGVYTTNYEQLHKIDAGLFGCVVLDESSILKNFTGKTKRLIIEKFKHIPFKLACTATPAPNDHMEIGNHSEFLDIMPSNEMLSRWFINDTMNMGGYRLKGHAVSDFWEWVSSWAVMLTNPSDLGYDSTGYDLPSLDIEAVEADTDMTDLENGKLFKSTKVNATTFNSRLRDSIEERMTKVVEIVNSKPDEPFIVWVNQNAEADALRQLLPDAIEVRGSDKPEVKESRLLGFANGEFRILITKKKIAQFGLNYQHCSNQVFASLDFSFEGLYQAIRRSYRFGQTKPVYVYLITIASMGNVLPEIQRKQRQFEEMQHNMTNAMKEIRLKDKRELQLSFTHKVEENSTYSMHRGDSCELIKMVPDNSIDFMIFSPPFANLYIYSDSVRDMGNCKDDDEFFEQFNFLIPELYRATRPGRLCAVHCKNLVNYKNSSADGMAGQRDFRGDIIRAFRESGWAYHAEVTIWKDPVIEMQRTKAHGLLYKQLRKDSSFSRTGMAEYLIVFRKWAHTERENERVDPIEHTKESFVLDDWQKIASPVWNTMRPFGAIEDELETLPGYELANDVWMDIQQTRVLNQKQAREEGKDEKHICPLQLDVIERALKLWTNPGDIVLSPFAGIGSEGYSSILMDRKFIGFELKEKYWEVACRNLRSAVAQTQQMSLFA